MADGVAGGEYRVHARNDFLAVVDELHPLSVRLEVLGRRLPEHLELGRYVAFGGPEIVVRLRNVVLRVREMAGAGVRDAAPTMGDGRRAHYPGARILAVGSTRFY